jgi:hypothetical protein
MGACRKGMYSVCTHRGAFHVALTQLGKTTLIPGSDEWKLLHQSPFLNEFRTKKPSPPYMPNQVFLYETSQLVVGTTTTKPTATTKQQQQQQRSNTTTDTNSTTLPATK